MNLARVWEEMEEGEGRDGIRVLWQGRTRRSSAKRLMSSSEDMDWQLRS